MPPTNNNNNKSSSSSNNPWTPFDCLVSAELTESGLLQKSSTNEVDLFYINDPIIELRAGVVDEPMTPIVYDTTNKNHNIDATKSNNDWYYKEINLSITVTTHRIVFWKTKIITTTSSTNNNNNNNNSRTNRIARYMHLSNVFAIETETAYFKSPKLVLSTALGDIVIAFMKPSNIVIDTSNVTTNNRDEVYKQIQLAIRRQLWIQDENEEKEKIQPNRNKPKTYVSRKVGVDAIVAKANYEHQHAAVLTETAFDGDAETLLHEAKALVKIIEKYVATLDRQTQGAAAADDATTNNNNDDDTNRLVNMLSDMGMTSALSKADFRGTEDRYYEELGRQLCDFIKPKIRTAGGIMTLTDVYCIYNRARGTHLISPEDLLHACKKMSKLQLGMSIHTFPSGLKVLQDDNSLNDTVLAQRFLQMIESNSSKNNNNNDGYYLTALSVSHQFHISAVLALEQLQTVERLELLVRDETLESQLRKKVQMKRKKRKKKTCLFVFLQWMILNVKCEKEIFFFCPCDPAGRKIMFLCGTKEKGSNTKEKIYTKENQMENKMYSDRTSYLFVRKTKQTEVEFNAEQSFFVNMLFFFLHKLIEKMTDASSVL